MTSDSLQRAVDFLSNVKAGDVDWSTLPASVDYGVILDMARQSGFETDESAIRQAFALIMRARLIASSAQEQSWSG